MTPGTPADPPPADGERLCAVHCREVIFPLVVQVLRRTPAPPTRRKFRAECARSCGLTAQETKQERGENCGVASLRARHEETKPGAEEKKRWLCAELPVELTASAIPGYGTDWNGPTVGPILGGRAGAGVLPPHWMDPLNQWLETAMFGVGHAAITDMARRTVRLALDRIAGQAVDATPRPLTRGRQRLKRPPTSWPPSGRVFRSPSVPGAGRARKNPRRFFHECANK